MTTLVKVKHRSLYPQVDPKNPLNNQSGRTILITGGGSGIGLAIAKAFVTASAARVIIIGRRANVLESASEELKAIGGTTEILSRSCDITDAESLKKMWEWVKDTSGNVDTLILNAVLSNPRTSISDKTEKVWKFFEMNVLANMRLTEAFLAQGAQTGKVLINISTAGTHVNPTIRHSSAYNTTKQCFTSVLQPFADEVPVEKCQILSVHPGIIVTESTADFKDAALPWTNIDLPAGWCVWASTKQASFLHGRFLWTEWGVDELEGMKDWLLSNPGLLRMGLQGVEPVTPAAMFKVD